MDKPNALALNMAKRVFRCIEEQNEYTLTIQAMIFFRGTKKTFVGVIQKYQNGVFAS